ncbi:hypothetical protein HK100_009425, partial [Physocladia obscura]
RRLALSTQPPPLPSFSVPQSPSSSLSNENTLQPSPPQAAKQSYLLAVSGAQTASLPASSATSNNILKPSLKLISGPGGSGPIIPLPGPPPFNPPDSVIQQYQQRLRQQELSLQQQQQQQQQQLSTSPPKLPLSSSLPKQSAFPVIPELLPQPTPQRYLPHQHYQNQQLGANNNNNSPNSANGTEPQLRISDRLAVRQIETERYNNMESELDSLLSAPSTTPAVYSNPRDGQQRHAPPRRDSLLASLNSGGGGVGGSGGGGRSDDGSSSGHRNSAVIPVPQYLSMQQQQQQQRESA